MTAPSSSRWLARRCLILAAGLVATAAGAQDAEKLTYDDHIRPLLENKCFSCHNPDKKKGGLELTSYAGLMNGGSGGAVVDAGNPQGSRLWTCSSKKEEPFMPPEGAPLDAKDLTLLSKWIAGGLLQAKGSVAKASARPKVDLSFAGGAGLRCPSSLGGSRSSASRTALLTLCATATHHTPCVVNACLEARS
jgi:hypothetical protein